MVLSTLETKPGAELETGVISQDLLVELSAAEWALEQFGEVDLGDKRLNRLAVRMAARMVATPEASLPNQMKSRADLVASYGLLNNGAVSMEALISPHCKQTLAQAGRVGLVLMVEDTTELDYSAYPSKAGLGPIGDGKGRGLLLHSTMAVVPEGRVVLGLAHAQVVLRQPAVKVAGTNWSSSPEAEVWETSAKAVGRPPEGVVWIHVSDRISDDFGYLAACLDLGKHFLVRAYHNRVLYWEEGAGQASHLLDYARSLPAVEGAGYSVRVEATKKQPAREAEVVLAWGEVTIPPPDRGAYKQVPIHAWVLRVWEPEPPEGAERVEWVLLCSLPVESIAEAYRVVDWYTCRWLIEDYHQCLKTGYRIERSQLDDGADIQRLLGFAMPIAIRLLQLRQVARQTPDVPAITVVDPLMLEVLGLYIEKECRGMTISQFWKAVAGLGGHQGRKGDGPPGWRTVWRGWEELSLLTKGAALALNKQ